MQATHTPVSDTVAHTPLPTLSPRNALWLLDQAGALRMQLGSALRSCDDDARAGFVREHLPAFCADVSPGWLSQFEDSIITVQAMIKRGEIPVPGCLAEEIVLYAVLGRCTQELDGETPPDTDPWYLSAPADDSDFDVEHLYETLVDDDTAILFDQNYDVDIDDSDDELAGIFGISHPAMWFDPFHPALVAP
jgi:hypothetical protein